MLGQVLIQFVLRLAFGLAAAMSATSPQWVTSGFFRVHLWVVLGLNTFVGAAVSLLPMEMAGRGVVVGMTVASAVVSYFGSVVWLYERKNAGRVLLVIVTLVNFAGALTVGFVSSDGLPKWANVADTLTSGLLLGTTFSAMLLGHWYLNTPSMKLTPLRRLIYGMIIVALVRIALNGYGLTQSWPSTQSAIPTWPFITLRWMAGFGGVLAMAWMSLQTLKIPNTQSATGILYVAVIFVFLGELASQLLSARASFPL